MSKDRLTLEQLKQESCFLDLTLKQQKAVEVFITSNGDRTAAVLAAYNVKPANAKILAYQIFESRRVVACLTVYFQDDPLESLKKLVARAMTKKHLTTAQVYALKFYCDLHDWKSALLPDIHGHDADDAEPQAAASKTPKTRVPVQANVPQAPAMHVEVSPAGEVAIADAEPQDPESHQVGDIVEQDGVKYKITAVDDHGKPTAAEEVN